MAESTRHRQAFEVYWRLGAERSIERLRDALHAKYGRAPSLRTLYGWSSAYSWQFRISDLEREARAAEDAARIEEIREMAERQAKEGLFLQQKGMEWLVGMDPGLATPEAATRAIVEGAKLERISLGEPTDRQEVRNEQGRLSDVSDEELAFLIRFAQGDLERGLAEESA